VERNVSSCPGLHRDTERRCGTPAARDAGPKNAFNTIFDSQAILNELSVKWPSLVDFFWQFCGTPAELCYGMEDGRIESILSHEGTQQVTRQAPSSSAWASTLSLPGCKRISRMTLWVPS